MSEGWALLLSYLAAVLAVALATWWAWHEHGRAEDAITEIDLAYLEGFDDGQADRRLGEGIVLQSSWPPRDSWHIDIDRGQLALPIGGGQRALPPAMSDETFTMRLQSGGHIAGTRGQAADADDQGADLDGWLGELHQPGPHETDTGWLYGAIGSEPWAGATARVDALAERYYRIMREKDGEQ